MLALLHLLSSVPPRPCRNLSRPLFLHLVLDVTPARSSHQARYNVDAATNRRFGALLSRCSREVSALVLGSALLCSAAKRIFVAVEGAPGQSFESAVGT